MVDNSKKVSELPQAQNVASTDRVMILRDPSGNASVRTITVNNFVANIGLNISGPFANDTLAASANVSLKGLYYDNTGTIKIRLI